MLSSGVLAARAFRRVPRFRDICGVESDVWDLARPILVDVLVKLWLIEGVSVCEVLSGVFWLADGGRVSSLVGFGE